MDRMHNEEDIAWLRARTLRAQPWSHSPEGKAAWVRVVSEADLSGTDGDYRIETETDI